MDRTLHRAHVPQLCADGGGQAEPNPAARSRPGGYVDPDEEPAATAAREVEEDTGWRPRDVRPLVSTQPVVGSADAENLLFVSLGAEYVSAPTDINEAEKIDWIPLSSVRHRMEEGEIIGAPSQVGLMHVLAFPPA